jgi:hypothetical protein
MDVMDIASKFASVGNDVSSCIVFSNGERAVKSETKIIHNVWM